MPKSYTFIYGLIDPNTNKIRYVGKSNNPNKRFRQHLSKSELKYCTYKNNWIKSLLANNSEPILQILAVVPYKNWQVHEVKWISKFDSLTNSTLGGEGASNLTKELRAKISVSKIGKPSGRKGKINSPAHIEAVRKAKLGSRHSKESIDRMCKLSYEITTPTGEIMIINNLTQFARENNLDAGSMHKVVKGNRKQHKGYTAKEVI